MDKISIAGAFTVLWGLSILDFISTIKLADEYKVVGYMIFGVRITSLSLITAFFTYYRI